MDFKEPWNLLFFSYDVLKRPLKITGRSPENFSAENLESAKWSKLLYEARTVFVDKFTAVTP